MIPLRDDNPTHHLPRVTIGLIALNVAAFLLQATLNEREGDRFIWKYGFVPAELVNSPEAFREELPEHAPVVQARDRRGRPLFNALGQPLLARTRVPVASAAALPAWMNLFTCMFLHAGWLHLIGNMWYLWIFGNNIEDRLGPVLFGVFYLGTGAVGSLAHTWWEASWVPLVGASGAVSGVMGAYILLFPHARILALVPAGYYLLTVKLPAWIFLGVYLLAQNLFPAYFTSGSHVAYWAHIGGFATGAALIKLFPSRLGAAKARRWRPIHDDDADIVI
jgi:membrane associated rhomboid family serine protease